MESLGNECPVNNNMLSCDIFEAIWQLLEYVRTDFAKEWYQSLNSHAGSMVDPSGSYIFPISGEHKQK